MEKTGGDVEERLAGVTPEKRRRDAATIAALMHDVTGRDAELWSGGIVGFGSYHYRYPTGTEGDAPILGFSPRKTSTTLYVLDGPATDPDALAALGPHQRGQSCLYLPDLAKVDLDVLRRIVEDSYARLTRGDHGETEITVTG